MKFTAHGIAVNSRASLLGSAAALVLAAPSAAIAQAQAPKDMPAGETVDGNDIIVTATKREQTLQDVPVAVSVTTADVIERAHIRDIKDLSTLVPSLRVGERANTANTNFFIRGFGNGANNAGIEPSVGVFVDGVYRSRSASQIVDLPDVQRIEVLRGPQSTLFGKNASAGVISIVTEKPKFQFGGNVEASYGNYDAMVLKGLVTGPVSETLALSLSGSYNTRDGYNHDLATGNHISDRDRWFVRGQALFEPDTSLRVRIIGDYGKIDELCCAVVNFKTGSPTMVLLSPLIGGMVNSPDQAFDNIVYLNFDPTNKIKNYGISGQVDYEFSPAATLTSITSWRRSTTDANFDTDFTSADLLRGANIGFADIKTFSQELRLNAKFGDRVNLLVGGFYFHEKIDQAAQLAWGTSARAYADQLVRAATGGARSIPTLELLFGALTGNPARYVGQFFAPGQGMTEDDGMKNENFSIFSQVDFEVTDRLTLTGGINYTHDEKDFSTNVQSTDVFAAVDLNDMYNRAVAAGANPVSTLALLGLRPLQYFPPLLNQPNSVEPGRTSDDKFTYTARLAYDVNDTVNVYLSYATGYKPSSISLSRDSRPFLRDAPAIAAAGLTQVNQTYGSRYATPENSTVFEAGLKGNWGVVTANVAVFQQAIKGFQSNIFTGSGFVLTNAGKQSVFGIEFEGMAKPIEPLTLGLAMTYLDPKYDDFKNSAFGDVTGVDPADIPEFSVTFSGEYDHEFGNGDHAILRASYHYESEVQVVEGLPNHITRNPITGAVQPGGYQAGLDAARPYTRQVDEVDASLTYAMHNGVELSLWGRNLLDDRYIGIVFDSPAQIGSVSGYTNQPRTYGGSVRYRW